MNRRAFFGSLSGVAFVAGTGLTETPAEPSRAVQCALVQCPMCFYVLDLHVPLDPDARRAWVEQETHLAHCDTCNLDVSYKVRP